MTENKNINLGEILNNSNIENFSTNENIIPQINKNNNLDNNKDTINLENIKIEEAKSFSNEKIIFENIELENKEKKHYRINYRKIFIISFLTIIITVSVSIGLKTYNNYINDQVTNIENKENKIISNINKIKDFLKTYLGLDTKHGAGNNYNLIGEDGINNLNEIIKSKINYIQKKDILSTAVKNLNNNILSNHKTLENLKKSISKEGFLSKEIGEIISSEEQISSIYNSLLSLESIKFSSAINVFPYLDTFIEGLSNASKISKKEIEEKNKIIISRGEKDINLYLKNCYLNPFESDYECSTIGDFEQYYNLNDDKTFDTSFFKSLIKYTDTKLEQSELPSFSIDFKKFDKNSNKISFNIDINTFKQDELELAKKGILSPHVFILNNLINNLKQSKFILGRGISVKTLKTEAKTIEIGSTEFTINNSNKSFTVEIQKESEREIDDFISTNN
ncbi:MAG TPA: hypothetical protein PK674_01580 [Candidatus Absconditabacterales bacterium]|nr:hypothetical protein [Candidatus Absconditabacterales bacterium]HOG15255.1 hypothetical protein [Candidatus Absconditabacterales bacterium]HOQ78854.1 hypothetical protein [Candidatus Absconditabacterales bacterium]